MGTTFTYDSTAAKPGRCDQSCKGVAWQRKMRVNWGDYRERESMEIFFFFTGGKDGGNSLRRG